jgi:hypothetical protein
LACLGGGVDGVPIADLSDAEISVDTMVGELKTALDNLFFE